MFQLNDFWIVRLFALIIILTSLLFICHLQIYEPMENSPCLWISVGKLLTK